MVKKLTFLLKNKIEWNSAFKALLAGLALVVLRASDFSPALFIAFFGVYLWIYLTSSPDQKNLRTSFFFALVLGVTGAVFLESSFLFGVALIAFVIFIFGLVGLSTLFLSDKVRVYGLLNTALILAYMVFAFESGIRNEVVGLIVPVVFVFTFFIFWETCRVFGLAIGRRGVVISSAIGLLAAELAFILTFLPLGSLNAAALSALLLIIAREGLFAYTKGVFNLGLGLRQLVFLLFFMILIFASSKWSFWAF